MVVGLGNPGPEYAATRHNVGFLVVDSIGSATGIRLARHKRAHALVGEGRLGPIGSGVRLILVQPLSFMNESGGPVKALMQFYDVDIEHLVVVHDELDIPFSSIRVKVGGGDGGHNGLKSIRRALGSGDFARVRVGIGRPPGRQDPADFVLKPFGSAERPAVPELCVRAADAVESFVEHGLERTQNQFNS